MALEKVLLVVVVVSSAWSCSERVRATDPDLIDAGPHPECLAPPDLRAEDVVRAGYDELLALPSDEARARRSGCPVPEGFSELPRCPTEHREWSWYSAEDRDEAHALLMWHAWCWHGVDLARLGRATCAAEPDLRGPGNSQSGDFACTVEYGGQVSDTWVKWRR